jgi:putative transposase
MPRRRRVTPGGLIYHVLNRGVGRMRLFASASDFAAFERIIMKALAEVPIRICAFCIMPNHWHFALWPHGDEDLSQFVQRLTTTHAARWRKHQGTVGAGHVYQDRYKSFPVEGDEHFYRVVRYVERNPLRANLVRRAEEWRWSSCWLRQHGTPEMQQMLSAWPLPLPTDWVSLVNQAQTEAEVAAIRRCVSRGQPFGTERWGREVSSALGLDSTYRGLGRPRRDEL